MLFVMNGFCVSWWIVFIGNFSMVLCMLVCISWNRLWNCVWLVVVFISLISEVV